MHEALSKKQNDKKTSSGSPGGSPSYSPAHNSDLEDQSPEKEIENILKGLPCEESDLGQNTAHNNG